MADEGGASFKTVRSTASTARISATICGCGCVGGSDAQAESVLVCSD